MGNKFCTATYNYWETKIKQERQDNGMVGRDFQQESGRLDF